MAFLPRFIEREPTRTHQEPTKNQPESRQNRPGNKLSIVSINLQFFS